MKKLLYIISVICCFTGCDDIIEEEDISSQEVTVLAPTHESVVSTTDVVFSWETLNDADSYKLQIASPNFENAEQILLDSTVTVTSFSNQLDFGTYQWRIRAENSVYFTEYVTQTFTVNANLAPDISESEIVLLSPANSTTFDTTDTLNFTWELIEDAEDYVLQIVTPDFDNATETIESLTTTDTSFSKSNLAAGTYQWRVKAQNDDFETAYTIQNFTIEE